MTAAVLSLLQTRATNAVRDRRRWSTLALLALCLGWSGNRATAQAVEASATPTSAVDVTAALKSASAQVAATKGLAGAERQAALISAASVYEQIVETHADNAIACAEAWFRLGELRRRLTKLGEAERAYAQAVALDAGRFGERGWFGVAQMQRRQERWDDAIASYRKAAAVRGTTARAHQARAWMGRCLQRKGDLGGAVAAFEQALELTTTPKRILELCNLLAKTRLAQGDLDGAEQVLSRAEAAVPATGPDAPKLRAALDKMSARKALQRARDKATGAVEDAVDVETSRAAGSGGALPLVYLVPTP
ncbi:MAG: tetratricopeptide repeat protein [Planctomycetota bacterium]